MSILLAQHLANGQFDGNKLATSWAVWAIHTSTKDVGIQTSLVLSEVARGQHWSVAVSGLPAAAAGNGSLMRVAPVALFQLAHSFDINDLARAQSRITHPNAWC
jgi:ADP-ribosylglycohydrolase